MMEHMCMQTVCTLYINLNHYSNNDTTKTVALADLEDCARLVMLNLQLHGNAVRATGAQVHGLLKGSQSLQVAGA